MKDRVASYEAQGFSPTKIAEICGCTPAYISQLSNDPEYKIYLDEAKKKIKKRAEEDKIEADYIRLENKVISQAEESLPFAEFRDLTVMMKTLIERKQKPAHSIVHNGNVNNHIAFLSLPSSVLPPEIVVNNQQEIVGIGEKSLVPMQTSSVRKLFQKIADQRATLQALPPMLDIKDIKEIPDDF